MRKQSLAAPVWLTQTDCSTFSHPARIHHTETRSSKWIYGLLLFYCHCPGETLQNTHVSVVLTIRCSGSTTQHVSPCRITHTHACTNDLIMKWQSQRILTIIQVLILPSFSFFLISFLNPFAEYKVIFKPISHKRSLIFNLIVYKNLPGSVSGI